ncbi:MAG: valine--tRNA ligase [Verrucomicrobia bacterium]|nr:valine--tRNA ligase [Verrucomicrobiota bacterium]
MFEISKAYDPKAVEDRWYEFWQREGCFTPDPARVSTSRPAYAIVIPPPNVTGMLHMGHVLNNTIQDILARKARMDGKEVLWLPGTDHAGIATQVQVEKALKKEEGKTKHDLGREEFLKRVWAWKEKHGGIIIQQLKKLGASCDWTRERFTMDPEYSRCVQKVFIALYQKGLIYRGKRMVNWCPASLTALSDEEVEMEPQKGVLYQFKVELAEKPGTWLSIATTRPETIPGDTAVAVNPKDPRYAHLIGLHVLRPLPAEFEDRKKRIPIVGDDHVDFEFGTGVLKVTPAHDKADFEIGRRHGLDLIDVMQPNGVMNDLAGLDLAGRDRFAARKAAVEKLRELGVLEKEEPYENKVGFSQRARVPVEPRLSEQWFLKYPCVEASKNCVAQDGQEVREGRMQFHPGRWAKVYDHWLTHIQDWCISRQLWWGHQIPVWTRRLSVAEIESVLPAAAAAEWSKTWSGNDPGQHLHWTLVMDDSGQGRISILQVDLDRSRPEDALVTFLTDDPEEGRQWTARGFQQDPDVLDTWFSSWLWPFATMGWPENTPALRAFYPTTDLVTGPDIIFFWVARMIMAGYEFMGEMPFRNVYFTGIIRDKQGRKMSKTLGNSPDPLELIAKYGADALRFGTLRSAPLGQDVLFDEKDVELGRNFCNKLWNACRFRQMQGGEAEGEIRADLLTSDDRWILARLDQALREIDAAYAEYRLSEVTAVLYRFFWNEYCDWYVEASKPAMMGAGGGDGESAALAANKRAVIDFALSHLLRLFHPFLPFITEELWQGMGFQAELPSDRGGKTIMNACWPKPLSEDEKNHFGLSETSDRLASAKYQLVVLGRNLRVQFNVPSSKKVRFMLRLGGKLSSVERDSLKGLLNAEELSLVPDGWVAERGTPVAANELGELYLPLAGLIDLGSERLRLSKELEKVLAEIKKVEDKLGNANFSAKVPPAVLEEHRKRLEDWRTREQQIRQAMAALN